MKEHSKPSAELLGELREVATASLSLIAHLRGDNSIPTTFPKSQLITVAEALSALPGTTTMSAGILLEYASRRLPAIRREHLRHHGSQSEESIDEAPEPARGTTLDQHLKDLIAAVGTALDECRSEAAQPHEEEEEPLEHRIEVRSDPEVDGLLKKSAELERSAAEAAGELHAARQPGSARADDLKRSIEGARTVNSAAAAELQMPETVLPWLQRLARGLNKYPAVFRGVGGALEKGADIAAPAWNRWHGFWHQVGEALIAQSGGFGKDLQKIADKWESERSRQAGVGAQPPSDQDAKFQTLIELSLDENDQTRRVAISQLARLYPATPGTAERLRTIAANDKDWIRGDAIAFCGNFTHDPQMGPFLRDLHGKLTPWDLHAEKVLVSMLAFASNRDDPVLMEKLRARVRSWRGAPLSYKRAAVVKLAEIAATDQSTREFLVTLIDSGNQRTSVMAIQSGQSLLPFKDVQLATIRALGRHRKHWEAVRYTIENYMPHFIKDEEVATTLRDLLREKATDPGLSTYARRLLDRMRAKGGV